MKPFKVVCVDENCWEINGNKEVCEREPNPIKGEIYIVTEFSEDPLFFAGIYKIPQLSTVILVCG